MDKVDDKNYIIKTISEAKLMDWEILAIKLKMEKHELDTIKREIFPNDVVKCSAEMIDKWISKDEDVSYQNLVRGLVDIGRSDIAEQIIDEKRVCNEDGSEISLTSLDGAEYNARFEKVLEENVIELENKRNQLIELMNKRRHFEESSKLKKKMDKISSTLDEEILWRDGILQSPDEDKDNLLSIINGDIQASEDKKAEIQHQINEMREEIERDIQQLVNEIDSINKSMQEEKEKEIEAIKMHMYYLQENEEFKELQEEVRKQKEDIQKKDDELKGKVDHICYLQKKVKIYETMIAILMTEMREKLLNESSDERRGQITEHYTSRIEGLKNEIKKVKRDYYKAVRERTPSKERDAIRCIHKEVLCNRCISKIYNDTTSSSCQIQ